MTLHTIIYSSREKTALSDEQKQELLEGARQHNSENGITGMLLYFDMVFFQVLEGPEDSLRALYAKIQNDPRHQDVTAHVDEAVSERLFPSWSMAYRKADGETVRSSDKIESLLAMGDTPPSAALHGQKAQLASLIGTVANSMAH